MGRQINSGGGMRGGGMRSSGSSMRSSGGMRGTGGVRSSGNNGASRPSAPKIQSNANGTPNQHYRPSYFHNNHYGNRLMGRIWVRILLNVLGFLAILAFAAVYIIFFS